MKHTLISQYRRRAKLLSNVCYLVILVVMGACSNSDDYYDRPSWLEPPIYDVLKEKGNFTMYLDAVDRTLYRSVLQGSGNYTVFAPNDEAFQKFLSEKGYTSIESIPVEELTKIIGYSMVYNKFESLHLGDVLVSGEWVLGSSIKKRSSYYKTIYKGKVNGVEQWIVDAKADLTTVATPYKYLPIFTASYFGANGLSDNDYKTFFPDATFSGLNVQGGQVVNSDIYAENGVIHEVNTVSYPLENLDEMLIANENTAFHEIMEIQSEDAYLFVNYLLGANTLELYKKLYPDRNLTSVYCKSYMDLPFQMNSEDYSGSNTATTEQEGYTLLVPSNAAVETFTEELKERTDVERLSELSKDVIGYFLKAHMVDGLVWPSNFQSSQNVNGEFVNAEGAAGPTFENSGITKSSFASNGIMYNIDHVVKSKYFNTVYSEILLNPKYRMTYYVFKNFYSTGLAEDLMKSPISGYMEENYTILLPSDELLKADGFTYDEIAKAFDHTLKVGTTISTDDRIKRLIRMCIFKRIKNNEVNTEIKDFSGSPSLGYDGYGYAVNDYGDMIRFKDNKIQAVGNIMDGEEVTATELTDFPYNNGHVFAIDKLLQFSPRNSKSTVAAGWEDQTMYECIKEYVTKNPEASLFKQYLDALLYTSTDGTIAGINKASFYTVLIPQNDAIERAIEQGYLPKLADVKATDENQAIAVCFLNTCFLPGMVISDDGVERIEPGNYEKISQPTSYKVNEPSLDMVAVKTYMEVTKEGGILKFRPKDITEGNTMQVEGINEATVIRDINKSNYMGPKTVIHAIDNFLTFKVHK